MSNRGIKTLVAAALAAAFMCPAGAAVTAQEAKQLGSTLTEFGAEKAGNADGSIPPYTGGIASMIQALPAAFKPGSGVYPDPFPEDKPLFSVNAKNMAQHAALLTPGTQALMQRFPTYRIDVYPTRRTMGYPESVLKDTVKNATRTEMVGAMRGDGITGAYNGIPFPMPKEGMHLLWNFLLRWQGTMVDFKFNGYLMDANGSLNKLSTVRLREPHLYNDPDHDTSADKLFTAYMRYTDVLSPASISGMKVLTTMSSNFEEKDYISWIYLPGQRRVRIAPEQSYDTPTVAYSGAMNYDEVGMFSGRFDRFDFKLVGKKEVYIPYNANKAAFESTAEELFQKGHLDPNRVRWERHRVWVVDATLKEGKRHVFSRRTMYFDEDTWTLVSQDAYDQAGKLYRISFAHHVTPYDVPAAPTPMQVFYDFSKNSYAIVTSFQDGGWMKPSGGAMPNLKEFTPDAMAGRGLR